MRETEIKLKYHPKDKDSLISYCLSQGLSYVKTVTEEDIYYSPAHRNYLLEGRALRLRQVSFPDGSTQTRITYKGKNQTAGLQDREELETSVEDGSILKLIFERLDFSPLAVVRKNRVYYQKDSFSVCLDCVDGLGDYFEVEILGQDDAQAALQAFLKGLPFSSYETEPKTYLELLLRKTHG